MGRRVAAHAGRVWPIRVVGIIILVTLWGALLLSPVRDWVSGASVAPLPPLVPGAVDALVAVVNAVRWVSPFLAAAAITAFFVSSLAGRASSRTATVNRLSKVEYAGIDHVAVNTEHRWRLTRLFQRFVGGTGLAVLAVVLVGATSGIEREVTNGPLRPIEALSKAVDANNVSYVFQSSAITFMDDSTIPVEQMDRFVSSSPATVTPFGKHLFNLNDRSAVELSIPDAAYSRVAGSAEGTDCDARTIVVDDTVGVGAGGTVTLNGTTLRVARVEDGIAQMNRSIAIISDSTARTCVMGGTSSSYFGAIVDSSEESAINTALHTAGVAGVAVSSDDFDEHNRDFWRANATPLLLQLILYIALFSGFAAAGERQSSLQRNSREIGMLHATGVDYRALQAIERRRALRTTLKAAVLAAPLMVPVAAAFNASELGVHISVGLTEITVGFSLTLIAMLLASNRALAQFRRSLDLPLAVKG